MYIYIENSLCIYIYICIIYINLIISFINLIIFYISIVLPAIHNFNLNQSGKYLFLTPCMVEVTVENYIHCLVQNHTPRNPRHRILIIAVDSPHKSYQTPYTRHHHRISPVMRWDILVYPPRFYLGGHEWQPVRLFTCRQTCANMATGPGFSISRFKMFGVARC